MEALTDDRVRYEWAPFDHPSLCLPIGHVESSPGVPQADPTSDSRTAALDRWALVPAVGTRFFSIWSPALAGSLLSFSGG
jgi:hypothetical protein